MAQQPNNFFAENIITIPSPGEVTGNGSGSIEIPKINVGTMKGEAIASLDFYQTDTWKSLNPKIFLFRHKKSKPSKNKPAGFVHPTHLIGSDVKWWGGSSRFTGYGENEILRHTEFQLPLTVPRQYFNLNNLGLSPYEWCTYQYQAFTGCNQPSIVYRLQGGKGSRGGLYYSDVTAIDIYNNKVRYQTEINGIPYAIYYSSYRNQWALLRDGDGDGDETALLNTNDDCPVGAWELLGRYKDILYFNFMLNNGDVQRRQSVQSDFPIPIQQAGSDGLSLNYFVNLNGRAEYSEPLSSAFSKEKMKFKFAIVIDNPNATKERPYLIGPMSDTIVLRFNRLPVSSPITGDTQVDLKFTPDHINRVIS
jgi:hypothetical protein